MSLRNVVLVVENIERSKAFYRDLFGLEVIRDFGSNVILTEGLVLQEKTAWEMYIDRSVEAGRNDALLYFEERAMNSFLERLENSSYKVEYVHPVMKQEGGQRVVRFYDLDRHMIEVGEAEPVCGVSGLVFALAEEEELPDILALYRAAVGTEGCTWSLDYPNEDILNDDFRLGNLFCMKDQKHEIVGVISIDVDETVAALPCWRKELSPAAELARLTVKETCQNQGIARLLLQAAMKELVRRGCHGVHFLVSKTNVKALRSYEKLEFERRGECNLYGTDWWCYEKALDYERMESVEDAV